MIKKLLAASSFLLPGILMAQTAMDAYQISRPDIKGTARFMSMGGAFGALGGDLSVLNQNPGGIGVYRSCEIGFTLELDAQQSQAVSQNLSNKLNNTPFYLNNAGAIVSINVENSGLRCFNLGFTFNKSSSLNNRFSGMTPTLNTSVTNYIAALANSQDITVGDLTTTDRYDPYNPMDGGYQAPWATILGYGAYFINPRSQADGKVHWEGQFGSNTTGSGYYRVHDKGAMDEYNIAFGGNINNWLYWGMDFGIVDLSYDRKSLWSEQLDNAYVANSDFTLSATTSDLSILNNYKLRGSGFNYKLGFIFRPIQELRLGIAMHTPTWYKIEQTYRGRADGIYGNHRSPIIQFTNNGYDAYYDYRFRTPWKIIASAAGVLANRFIISADYEWCNYKYMKYADKFSSDYFNPMDDPFYYTNSDIKDYYQSTSTMRLGLEGRLSKNLSLRAGYAISSSPVKQSVQDNEVTIYTDGCRLDYSLDDRTYYITGGIGFHVKGFYTDLAYVYKNRQSSWRPFPTDIIEPSLAPSVKVTSANHQVVLSIGYKF